MNWTTIYITGKPGFEKDLQRRIERTELPIMNGADGLPSGTWLCWIDEELPLRELKQTVGADLIWKYRLLFSRQLEAFPLRYDQPFTDPEKRLMETSMKRARKNQVMVKPVQLSFVQRGG